MRIGARNLNLTLPAARRVTICTPIKTVDNKNAGKEESPKPAESVGVEMPMAAVPVEIFFHPKGSGACQEEHTRCVIIADERDEEKDKEPVAVVQGTADINARGDSRDPFVTDDLHIADELSAISMAEVDHRQILEELEDLF